MKSFNLRRTKQCSTCPWKVDVYPYDIPNGYSKEKHEDLKNTIADPSDIMRPTNAMACHHSQEGDEDYCIGWLENQIGAGNNIPLRMKMLRCENFGDVETFGQQHETFEDTLPE